MGKSSSSRKKERSKTSSSQRIRRKSRSSRKLKSKKLRHRHDSPSCSDTDFESSTSVSYSSLEDDEKVARSRSKTRKNAKPSKKRAKKRSHDHGSRDCSPHPRKRKHSKINERCEEKKTNKKKRRTDVSVSVTSSDSLIHATCGDGSTTNNEGEIDRRRGTSGKRKGNRGKTERSRYRSKSRSPCSARSGGSDHQNEVEDASYVENNFRRLRSVIVVVGEENKLETFYGNEQQEEVMHQPDDDHPSFGDMECKDGASERDLDFVTLKEAPEVENKKEMVIPNSRNSMVLKDDGVQHEGSNNGGVANGHSLNERKNGCSGNSDSINCIDLESILRQRALENLRKFKGVPPRNVETPGNCEVGNNNDVKQLYSPVSKSVHVTSPRDDAKINGKGFSRQGEKNAVNSMIVEENSVKSTDAIDSAVSSMHDPVYSSPNLGKISNGSIGKGFSRQGGENVVNSMIVKENGVKSTDAIDLAVSFKHDPVYSSPNLGKISNGSNGKGFSRQDGENAVNSMIVEENGVKSTDAIDSAVASMHNPVCSSRNLGKISNGSNGMNELKQDISSLDHEVVNDNICQKADADICSTTNKSNLVIAALRPESKVDSLTKQASASQQSVQTKPSISDIGVDEIAHTQTQMRNDDDQNIGNGFGSSAHKPSSSLNSISGEHSLNKSGHESGESSQFEQKTMSVMRGGEMVQVNYKVYIPKRAPALARRQLKR